MISKVEFKNFKLLRDAVLPLSNFTLIVGPNASGKSTALEALRAIAPIRHRLDYARFLSIGTDAKRPPPIEVTIHWAPPHDQIVARMLWHPNGNGSFSSVRTSDGAVIADGEAVEYHRRMLMGLRHFSFDPSQIAAPVALQPNAELQSNGSQLAGVLDRLRDNYPERFEAINEELTQWLPDYDRILFDTPASGQRAFQLRAAATLRPIKASDLSEGTLLALALLTLAYLPEPPTIITIEEPDRGIHPRLLRHLQDALYRLSYPKDCGETREPVQVIATTHSPYFLDLFKNHSEEIVIAEKHGLEATFTRLSDLPNINEILRDAPLGEAWFSGILGGVPVGT